MYNNFQQDQEQAGVDLGRHGGRPGEGEASQGRARQDEEESGS